MTLDDFIFGEPVLASTWCEPSSWAVMLLGFAALAFHFGSEPRWTRHKRGTGTGSLLRQTWSSGSKRASVDRIFTSAANQLSTQSCH